jgi:hypothetical protein
MRFLRNRLEPFDFDFMSAISLIGFLILRRHGAFHFGGQNGKPLLL